MKQLSQQEVFDKVWTALSNQGIPAVAWRGRCRYHHNGLKCAIGHLIPEKFYNSNIEGKTIKELSDLDPDFLFRIGLNEVPVDFLRDLQQAHDHDFYSLDRWKTLMRLLAQHYNLTVPA